MVHGLNPPYSFDYLYSDGKLVKTYNDIDFILQAIIANHHEQSDFFIHEMSIKTNSFKKNVGRILRQNKQKGFYDPVKFKFTPSTIPGGKMELLKDQKYKVPAFTEEGLLFELEKAEQGFYEIQIQIHGLLRSKSTTLLSPIFFAQHSITTGRHFNT